MSDANRRTQYTNIRNPRAVLPPVLSGPRASVHEPLKPVLRQVDGASPTALTSGDSASGPPHYSSAVTKNGPKQHTVDLKVALGIDAPQRLPPDTAEAVYHEFLVKEAERIGLRPDVVTLKRLAQKYPPSHVITAVRPDVSGTRACATVTAISHNRSSRGIPFVGTTISAATQVKGSTNGKEESGVSGSLGPMKKAPRARVVHRKHASLSDAMDSFAEHEVSTYLASKPDEPLTKSLSSLSTGQTTTNSLHFSEEKEGECSNPHDHIANEQGQVANGDGFVTTAKQVAGIKAGGLLMSPGIIERVRELVDLASAVANGSSASTTNPNDKGSSSPRHDIITAKQARIMLQERLQATIKRQEKQQRNANRIPSQRSSVKTATSFDMADLLRKDAQYQEGEIFNNNASLHDQVGQFYDEKEIKLNNNHRKAKRACSLSLLSPTWMFGERTHRVFAPTPIEFAKNSEKNNDCDHVESSSDSAKSTVDQIQRVDDFRDFKGLDISQTTASPEKLSNNAMTSNRGEAQKHVPFRSSSWTIPLDTRDPSVMKDILSWYRLTAAELAETIDPRLHLQTAEINSEDPRKRYSSDVIRSTFEQASARTNYDFQPTQFVHIDVRDPSKPKILLPKSLDQSSSLDSKRSQLEDVHGQNVNKGPISQYSIESVGVSPGSPAPSKQSEKHVDGYQEIMDIWGVPIMAPEIPFSCFIRFNNAQTAVRLPAVRVPATASVIKVARDETLRAAVYAAEEAAIATLKTAAPVSSAAESVLAASTAAALRVASSIGTLLPSEVMYNRFLSEEFMDEKTSTSVKRSSKDGDDFDLLKKLDIHHKVDHSSQKEPQDQEKDYAEVASKLAVPEKDEEDSDIDSLNAKVIPNSDISNSKLDTDQSSVSSDVVIQLPSRLLSKPLRPPMLTVNKLAGNAFIPLTPPGPSIEPFVADLNSLLFTSDEETPIHLPRLLYEQKIPFIPRREHVRHLQRTFIEAIPWGVYEHHYSMSTFLAVRGYIASLDMHELIIVCAHIVHAVIFRTGSVALTKRSTNLKQAEKCEISTKQSHPASNLDFGHEFSEFSSASDRHADQVKTSDRSTGEGGIDCMEECDEENEDVSEEAIQVLVQCARVIFNHIDNCGRKHKIQSDSIPDDIKTREINAERARMGVVSEKNIRKLNNRILGPNLATISNKETPDTEVPKSRRCKSIAYTTVVRPLILDAIDSCVSNLLLRHYQEWHKIPLLCEPTQALVSHIIDVVLNEHSSVIRPGPLRSTHLGHSTHSLAATSVMNLSLGDAKQSSAIMQKLAQQVIPASIYHSDHIPMRRLLSGMLTFALTSLATVSKAISRHDNDISMFPKNPDWSSSINMGSRRDGSFESDERTVKSSLPILPAKSGNNASLIDIEVAAELDRVLLSALRHLEDNVVMKAEKKDRIKLIEKLKGNNITLERSSELVMYAIEPDDVPQSLFRLLCYVRSRVLKWGRFADGLVGIDSSSRRGIVQNITKAADGSALVVRIVEKPDFSKLRGVHPNASAYGGEINNSSDHVTARLELELTEPEVNSHFVLPKAAPGSTFYSYLQEKRTFTALSSEEKGKSQDLSESCKASAIREDGFFERPMLFSPCAGSMTWNRAIRIVVYEASRHMILAPILLEALGLCTSDADGFKALSKQDSQTKSRSSFDWKSAFPLLSHTSIVFESDSIEERNIRIRASDPKFKTKDETVPLLQLKLPKYAFAPLPTHFSTWTRANTQSLLSMKERQLATDGRNKSSTTSSNYVENNRAGNQLKPLFCATSSFAKPDDLDQDSPRKSNVQKSKMDEMFFDSTSHLSYTSSLPEQAKIDYAPQTQSMKLHNISTQNTNDFLRTPIHDSNSFIKPHASLSLAAQRGLNFVAEHELSATTKDAKRLQVKGPRLFSATANISLLRLHPEAKQLFSRDDSNTSSQDQRGPPLHRFYRTQTADLYSASNAFTGKNLIRDESTSNRNGNARLGDDPLLSATDSNVFFGVDASWLRGSSSSEAMIILPEMKPLDVYDSAMRARKR